MVNLKNMLVTSNRQESYILQSLHYLKSVEQIIIFGVGRGGKNVLNLLEEHGLATVVSYCDNDVAKQGMKYRKIPIVSPEDSVNLYPNATYIISCVDDVHVRKQLLSLGVTHKQMIVLDLTLYDTQSESFIFKNIDKYNTVYQWLSDDDSKKVFVNLLNYKITRDAAFLKPVFISNQKQYFNELVKSVKGKIFVDVGASVGDTLEEYINWCNGTYERIVCFEADENNQKKISDLINEKRWKNIQTYPIAVSKEKGKLKFNAISVGGGFISNDSGKVIACDSLDNVLTDEKVDFIKLDIEGGEYDALLGAQNIIQKCHPVIACCVYHKIDDFFKLPQVIRSIYPYYRFYFRHYTLTEGETVCYALPDDAV
ncbi:MAG: FkbM family methyltransferase [Sporolactobacillus sp.]